MTKEEPKKSLKARAAYEVRELIIVVLYLTFFFCTLVTYSMVLQKTYDSAMANYGEAVIKALVIGKIILIGEALKVGRKFESQPLLPFSAVKAFVYTLIVFAFHIVELLVVSLFQSKGLDSAFHSVRFDDLFAKSFVVFSTFIPFFAFRELGRRLGEDKFKSLVFSRWETPGD
jgi:magnesium-transporting ATPase (P-type)